MNEQVVRSYPELKLDVDTVLRGQGADPALIRQRKPRLVDIAEQALLEGMQLLEPVATYRIFPVDDMGSEYFSFAGQVWLTSPFVVKHLVGAQQIAVLICTLGIGLDNRIEAAAQDNPVYAYMLDGLGTQAAKTLHMLACAELEADARNVDLYTSIPLLPGMNGWPIEVGQPRIFDTLDAKKIGVTLNESAQMIPRKSLSMIMGISQSSFTTESL